MAGEMNQPLRVFTAPEDLFDFQETDWRAHAHL